MTDEFKAKVVLVGPPGVGKTSLVHRFVLEAFEEHYRATLGAIVYKRIVIVDVAGIPVWVTMTIWDTMGDLGLVDALRDVYLDGAQGVLAVGDVADAGTVQFAGMWVDAAREVAGDVPVQILLNKSDLESRDARAAGLRAGLDRGSPCYLTSARAGDNVVAAFSDLARRIVERILVPAKGPLDDVDRGLVIDCTREARTVDALARAHGLPELLAEARVERLRSRGLLRIASLDLDLRGRPTVGYARTGRAAAELLASRGA